MDACAPLLFTFAARLELPLAPHEARAFEDGEHKTRPLAIVRERDVFVLHALHGAGGESVNDRLASCCSSSAR